MKKINCIFLIFISNFIYSQNNFEINLTANSYINDSLMFGAPSTRNGFGDLYTFKISPNKNVSDFGQKITMDHSVYYLKIQKENTINGFIEYPQPVSFVHLDKKNKSASSSKIFFLEKGKYKIDLPSLSNGLEINIESPTNLDYKNLQKTLEPVYVKSKKPYEMDSLISLKEKQKILGEYIKKRSDSYAALWEILNDYTLYNYHSDYLKNMKLFSTKFKENKLFKNIESRLKSESLTAIGNKIPDIYFDKQNKLMTEDFKKYSLTFIDYWSTSCAPCIKSMPEIVALHEEFKNVNFITITDENKTERMQLAKNILKKNNVTWTNFFDRNKDFQKKVNATSYPLYFLIDKDGKIIARSMGDIEEVKKKMTEYLK
ncbi:thiol-disulfide isomerase/thioredoxin [Chryseobacterium ginsenosidimutans]|uniref:TlpA family protein disulfide reductase n=1 Tax=Chryseobacterium ginsenosidimutans TaxID=687846 RepID=UPI00216A1C47|nr:TlpA disulfide reductase family protein [Chryseobacterium ginsenosidimutans]MCS3867742.1 thiol-disulfide isomerase/thioredoxin [Chryseobacterium ginsenosidimutans]